MCMQVFNLHNISDCCRMYRLRGDKTPIQTGRHTSDHRLLSQHAPSNKKCGHHSSWKPDSKEFTPTYIEHIKSHLPCGGIKANLNIPPTHAHEHDFIYCFIFPVNLQSFHFQHTVCSDSEEKSSTIW